MEKSFKITGTLTILLAAFMLMSMTLQDDPASIRIWKTR